MYFTLKLQDNWWSYKNKRSV